MADLDLTDGTKVKAPAFSMTSLPIDSPAGVLMTNDAQSPSQYTLPSTPGAHRQGRHHSDTVLLLVHLRSWHPITDRILSARLSQKHGHLTIFVV